MRVRLKKILGVGKLMKSRLKEVVKSQGRTQNWLSEQVGVNKATISQIITNKTTPTLVVAYRIAKVLGLKIEDIWYEDETNEDNT
jgi:putative transcriptional regulator